MNVLNEENVFALSTLPFLHCFVIDCANNRAAVKALFDTGASVSVISKKLILELRIQRQVRWSISLKTSESMTKCRNAICTRMQMAVECASFCLSAVVLFSLAPIENLSFFRKTFALTSRSNLKSKSPIAKSALLLTIWPCPLSHRIVRLRPQCSCQKLITAFSLELWQQPPLESLFSSISLSCVFVTECAPWTQTTYSR